MEQVNQLIVQGYRKLSGVIGVIAVRNTGQVSPQTNGFDLLLLVVYDRDEYPAYNTHYIKDQYRIQEHKVSRAALETWIRQGENKHVIQWILQGEIWLDRFNYVSDMRGQLLDFPLYLREQKLLEEFSCFLSYYFQSKQYMKEGHIFDAYSSILEALRHWARVVIIKNGYHPEIMVWEQVHKINPGVYKLYEELTQSSETMEQKVKLMLLACEFSIGTEMGGCSALLIRILGSRERPWSVKELEEHPDLNGLHLDLAILLRKLAHKAKIREVAVPEDDLLTLLELKYTSI